ncbi:MAG: hypothetical protein IPM69_09970 [Ignavibacteria bacterium]|nr:hypothetical protein [Ignavibacteria bacterium]
MRREIRKWWSPRLNKEMEIVAYGTYGFALLMFPQQRPIYLEISSALSHRLYSSCHRCRQV